MARGSEQDLVCGCYGWLASPRNKSPEIGFWVRVKNTLVFRLGLYLLAQVDVSLPQHQQDIQQENLSFPSKAEKKKYPTHFSNPQNTHPSKTDE